jgi:hypothetical protein
MSKSSADAPGPEQPWRLAGRWLNSTVLGIGLASLCSDVGHEMATTALPAFLATIGASSAALGLIEGLADGLSSFAKLLSGLYSDPLRRRKPLAVVGYFVTASGMASFALATQCDGQRGGRFPLQRHRGGPVGRLPGLGDGVRDPHLADGGGRDPRHAPAAAKVCLIRTAGFADLKGERPTHFASQPPVFAEEVTGWRHARSPAHTRVKAEDGGWAGSSAPPPACWG